MAWSLTTAIPNLKMQRTWRFIQSPPLPSYASCISRRMFSIIAQLQEKPLPPRLKIPETELQESFLKGSGPGGQKINKTSSAVQLKHLPTGLVVKSQHTRSREQNRKYARQILAEKLDQMAKGSESRVAIKTERARVKKASAAKKSRRKYRKLQEDQEENGKEGDVEEEHSGAREAEKSAVHEANERSTGQAVEIDRDLPTS